jgi:hypothetical protein
MRQSDSGRGHDIMRQDNSATALQQEVEYLRAENQRVVVDRSTFI